LTDVSEVPKGIINNIIKLMLYKCLLCECFHLGGSDDTPEPVCGHRNNILANAPF